MAMHHQKTLNILILLIAVLALVATTVGIFSTGGPGPYEYTSIRGEAVMIYGEGVYRHMSAEVAPQGIGQDYITLFLGTPLLLISFFLARGESLKGRFLLAGTLGYFLVTYFFYLVMGMYNILFLVYIGLLGASFFAFALTMLSFNPNEIPGYFEDSLPVKPIGGFLIFNSLAIALLWLSVIIPPLFDGSIIPMETEHYTTLIAQGLDLAILLPLGFVSGILFIQKKPFGYLLTPVYFVFLSILMLALVAKVIAMGLEGFNIIPVVFIIPVIGTLAIFCSIIILRNIKQKPMP